MKRIDALAKCALEQSSIRTYGTGMRRFAIFVCETCESLNVATWKYSTASDLRTLICSRGVLEAFILHCFDYGLMSSSIEGYMHGVKFFASNWEDIPSIPIPGAWMVKQMLKGCQKLEGPRKDGTLPVGMIRLRKVLNLMIAQDGVNDYDTIFWTALFVCAYYAAFRVSEFLIGEDEAKWLTLNHVILRSDGWICFEIYKTKNNQVGRMQPVLFPQLVGEITCPARAIRNYLRVRTSTAYDAPFFVDRRGTPLSRGRFNDKLKNVMLLVEPELIGRFSSKSFRIGATSDSYALNIPTDDIGNLGRWAVGSVAFMHYVIAISRAERAVEVRFKLAGIGKSDVLAFNSEW